MTHIGLEWDFQGDLPIKMRISGMIKVLSAKLGDLS